MTRVKIDITQLMADYQKHLTLYRDDPIEALRTINWLCRPGRSLTPQQYSDIVIAIYNIAEAALGDDIPAASSNDQA